MLSISKKKQIVSLPLRIVLIVLAFIVCFSAAAQHTFAATFTVTRNDDRNAVCVSNVDCSLREAVSAANAAPTSDTINFAAGLTLITLASGDAGDIAINNNGSLTITGPGANVLTIDGGAGSNRIFFTNEAIVTLSGVTMQGGNGDGTAISDVGGAIFAFKGTLTLDSVVVENNGGATVSGGGVSFVNNSGASIVNSTFSGNYSSQCGAFNNLSGTLVVTNTTVSGNTANFFSGAGADAGGGFCNGGGMNLRNSTVTGNSATTAGARAGGIYNYATLAIANSIVAGNTATFRPEIENFSVVLSNGNNIIGDSANDSSDTATAITYQASDILDTPPLLGSLASNGGATRTHALAAGSPAIDKGNNTLAVNIITNTALVADQRGSTRIVDGDGNGTATVDIGAVEAQNAPTAASVTIGGRVLSAEGRAISRAVVSLINASGEIRYAATNTFGYYRFADVAAGETYVFAVSSKRYNFSRNPQVRTVVEETSEVDFTADN
jgi:CSLREA domain-containing protein